MIIAAVNPNPYKGFYSIHVRFNIQVRFSTETRLRIGINCFVLFFFIGSAEVLGIIDPSTASKGESQVPNLQRKTEHQDESGTEGTWFDSGRRVSGSVRFYPHKY